MIANPSVYVNKAWFASYIHLISDSTSVVFGTIKHLCQGIYMLYSYVHMYAHYIHIHIYTGLRSSILIGCMRSAKILQTNTIISVLLNNILDGLWLRCLLGQVCILYVCIRNM